MTTTSTPATGNGCSGSRSKWHHKQVAAEAAVAEAGDSIRQAIAEASKTRS